MGNAVEITHSEDGAKGRYEARIEGRDGVAELTYSRLSDDRIIADHTGVDDSLRGLGVGQALVERLVSDARAEGFRIVPQCSFVKAQLRRHPDWSDVIEA